MTIAGMPALVARTWMRQLTGNNSRGSVRIDDLSPEERVACDQLAEAGFFERSDDHPGKYLQTIDGAGLAMASASRPVKRSTAERAVSDLISRAAEINDDPDLVMWVDKVAIFGSYLDPSVERLGDVDCAAWFSRRTADSAEHRAASLERANRGPRGLSFIEQLAYGETEVRQMLKGRSPVISLHDAESDCILDRVELRVVYERPSGHGAVTEPASTEPTG
jgi:hypothetical protein